MATKFYFHSVLAPVNWGPIVTGSSLTVTVSDDPFTTNRIMDTTVGVSQTSLGLISAAQMTQQNQYVSKWVSPPINQTSIAANTWTYAFATQCSDTNAVFGATNAGLGIRITCYVWRPSTQTKVGNILDGTSTTHSNSSGAGFEFGALVTFTGASVASTLKGDVIVFEVWFQTTQTAATAFTDTFYFNGTTDPADGSTSASSATFISTPETITLLKQPLPQTVYVEWEEA